MTRNAETRRPYERPKLRVIELTSEELMGEKCKFNANDSGMGGKCWQCGALGS